MNKKISVGMALAITLLVATLTIWVTWTTSQANFNQRVGYVNERRVMYDTIAEIDSIVRNNYYGEINEQILKENIAGGYIEGLDDRYGSYFTAKELVQFNQHLAGENIGIGVKITKDSSGEMYIMRVFPNGSGEKAGLKKGDIITAVEGTKVSETGYENAYTSIQGDEGSIIRLTVKRGTETKEYELKREKYTNYSVSAQSVGGVGIITVEEFNANTPRQFVAAVDELRKQNVSGLVFDMRNNPGGTLDSVSAILDYLLPAGDIVSREDKNGVRLLYVSDEKAVDLPMSVLVNDSTASAAELFSCALKDYAKAQLVGEKTYGKGCMQSVYSLSDGAINITVAKFNPPQSPNFDGIGIEPDHVIKLTDAQKGAYYQLTPETDPQLKKALELLGVSNFSGINEILFTPLESVEPAHTPSDSGQLQTGGLATGLLLWEGTVAQRNPWGIR